MDSYLNSIHEAADYIKSRIPVQPEIGLVLGSGWGDFADSVEQAFRIPYNEVPGFPAVTYRGGDMADGIRYVKECLHEELLTSVVIPQIPDMSQVMLDANQVLMQVQV